MLPVAMLVALLGTLAILVALQARLDPDASAVEVRPIEAPAGSTPIRLSDGDLARLPAPLARAVREAAAEGEPVVVRLDGSARREAEARLADFRSRAPAPAHLEFGGRALTVELAVP